MFASKDALFTPPSGAYTIARSVRLRSSASAYFNRTPASAGNLTTWTYSAWIKRGILTSAGTTLFGSGANSTNDCWLEFSGSGGIVDCLDFMVRDASTVRCRLSTTQVFRDASAWYHIVLVWDSTQATSTNRAKLYINGLQVTAFSTATYPAQNTNSLFNSATTLYLNRARADSPDYFDGYQTEVNFIDGQALTPSSFGSTNAITGVWQPAKYTGTYGTNGFYLNFSDNSSNTSTTIGKDYSGNGNNWTPNNISVTSGATYDSMIDVPTLYADGGNGRGNYCVLNPLQLPTAASTVLSNANLLLTCNSGTTYNSFANGTMYPTSGKYYAEFYINTVGECYVGISRFTDASTPNSWNSQSTYYNRGGVIQKDNSTVFSVATYTTGDTIGVAYDVDNATCAFYKNNTLVATVTGVTAGSYTFSIAGYLSCATSFNTGQRPFTYTPPSGYVALNTYNLPASTISNGALYMNAVTRSGFGTSGGSITSLAFKPDFFWEKSRNNAYDHQLLDSVRGVGASEPVLKSNLTNAESTVSNYVTSFNSNGYTLGSNDYATSVTLVDWVWNAGSGSSSSNTSGSITSTVSVNATAGFSIVTWTTPASGTYTVGHGLGVAPSMIIVKDRSSATSWPVYHISTGNANQLQLNTTIASTASSTMWNSTTPTSTVFSTTVGATSFASDSCVAYCWSAVKGFSAFGSYTGNGSTDGPFVYTGFRPRYVMWKRTDTTGDWVIQDTTRGPYNQTPNYLIANTSGTEGSAPLIDINSNGFKIRINDPGTNASGGTYIYACFAENPLKYALAR